MFPNLILTWELLHIQLSHTVVHIKHVVRAVAHSACRLVCVASLNDHIRFHYSSFPFPNVMSSHRHQWSVMACLDGRFLAHLSPDTMTGDDGRQQPDTSNDTAEAVGWSGSCSTGSKKWHRYLRCSHSAPSRWTPCDLSSGLLHISVCHSLLDTASGYLVHLRSPRRCLLVPCKHIINLCRATTSASWRPTTRWQICRLNMP